MYLEAKITVDPSQLTQVAYVKPTKGFARIANILTAGAMESKEEHETFCAVMILQQVNLVMRSVGVDNVVRLAKDDIVFYEDTEGETDDLQQALDLFEARATPEEIKRFDTLTLVLENHRADLSYLLDVCISRTHAVGEHPIRITVTGIPSSLTAEDGEDQVRRRMKSVFNSQLSYDKFVEKHRKSFLEFVGEIEAAFKSHMKVDDVAVSSSVKIIRPSRPIQNRSESPSTMHNYHGFPDLLFYAWLWSDYCHSNDVHCHDCTVVDSSGADVLEVGSEGFQAGECSTLNTDEPFSVPEATDVSVVEGSEYSCEITSDAQAFGSAVGDDTKSSDWSFGDLFSGDSGGGGSFGGGDDGGGGCGGGCGGE